MINKFFLLIATGMPGLHKVVLFSLVNISFSLSTFGKFSNDFYLIQMFLLFNALGLIGLIMIKIPKCNMTIGKEYVSKITATFHFFLILSIPLLFLLKQYDYVFFLFSSFLLLLGMGGNLIARNYYLSHKNYILVVKLDLYVLILLIFSLSYKNDEFSPLLITSLIYISSYYIFLFFEKISFTYKIIPLIDLKKSFDISIINFLSAGVYFLLIPIVNKKLGVEYAGLIGMISVISTVMLLVPRALSLHYLPDFSRYFSQKKILIRQYKSFVLISFLSLIILFLFSFLVLFILKVFLSMKLFNLDNSIILYILFMFSVLISQLSLPAANMLLALEETKFLTKINFILVVIYLFSYLIITYFNKINNFHFVYIVLLVMMVGNFSRYVVANNYVKNILEKS